MGINGKSRGFAEPAAVNMTLCAGCAAYKVGIVLCPHGLHKQMLQHHTLSMNASMCRCSVLGKRRITLTLAGSQNRNS